MDRCAASDDALLLVLRTVPHAPIPGQRYADSSCGDTAHRRRRRGDSGGRWPPSSVRAARGLNARHAAARGMRAGVHVGPHTVLAVTARLQPSSATIATRRIVISVQHAQDVDAPVHAADQCVLKKDRESCGSRGPLLHVLQLLVSASTLRGGPAMEAGVTDTLVSRGNRRAARVRRQMRFDLPCHTGHLHWCEHGEASTN
jgi:hypothetical protein